MYPVNEIKGDDFIIWKLYQYIVIFNTWLLWTLSMPCLMLLPLTQEKSFQIEQVPEQVSLGPSPLMGGSTSHSAGLYRQSSARSIGKLEELSFTRKIFKYTQIKWDEMDWYILPHFRYLDIIFISCHCTVSAGWRPFLKWIAKVILIARVCQIMPHWCYMTNNWHLINNAQNVFKIQSFLTI